MFGGLRQGNLLYVLEKTAQGVALKVAQVESVSNPQPRYGQVAQYGNTADMVVDVRAKVGEESMDFKQLSTSLSIANSGNLVISDSKEIMSSEVETLMRTSRQAIESVPYHEGMLSECEVMLKELNPQFAREKEQEEKIDALEGKMGRIEGTLDKIQSMLSSLTNRKS